MKRRFDDGGEVDALEEANKREPIPMEPGPKAEPEKPKSFSQAFREARAAGDKTFMWQGKKYGTQLASGASSRSSAPVSGRPRGESYQDSTPSGVADERARLAARFGTAEQRSKYSKDQMIPQSQIDAAKAAGEERRRKIREQDEAFSEARNRAIKRTLGTQAMREDAGMKTGGKVKGYAKGGSIDGCAQRGKTKGRYL